MRRTNSASLAVRLLAAGAVAAIGLLASGCSSPSGNIDTAGQTSAEVNNSLTITTDTNWRLFNEDLGRLLLLDKPSRLTPRNLDLY